MINMAYARLGMHCNHIPDNQKLSKLQPLILELLAKRSPNHFFTISDIAELKYILSQSNHQTGLDVKTRALYNKNPLKHGNTVHIVLNTPSSTLKMKIFDDLEAIQTSISSRNQ
jgi:hypothetical protein